MRSKTSDQEILVGVLAARCARTGGAGCACTSARRRDVAAGVRGGARAAPARREPRTSRGKPSALWSLRQCLPTTAVSHRRRGKYRIDA